jgi:hypothetical protein
MGQYRSTMTAFATFAAFGLVFLPGGTMAQQKSLKEQIVGTWSLVSVDNVEPNGTRSPLYGPNPKGIVVFEPGGHYALQLTNPSVPKFAANNRNAGTADENKAAVLGNLAHFGTYSIEEADHSFTLRIEGSSFPNWAGAEQKRGPVAVAGDDLKWTNPGSSVGGSSELVWKRAK